MKLNVKGKYEAEKDNEMNLKKKVGMYKFLICRAVSVGLWSLKPCPFESGLKKFALEPVVMFFFQKMSKRLQVLADPVVIFFEMHLIQHL